MPDNLATRNEVEFAAQAMVLAQHLQGLDAGWASYGPGNECSGTVNSGKWTNTQSLGSLRCAIASSGP
jgi:hypothetical protein